jgi:hypothetical protein
VRRARSEQGCDAGRLVEAVGAARELLRAPEAAFEEGLPRLPHGLVGTVRAGVPPESGHLLGQPRGVRGEPEQPVDRREQRERREQEKGQGDLDAPGRIDEQRVALAVTGRQRERDCERGDDDESHQPAHRRPTSPRARAAS